MDVSLNLSSAALDPKPMGNRGLGSSPLPTNESSLFEVYDSVKNIEIRSERQVLFVFVLKDSSQLEPLFFEANTYCHN